MPLLNYSWRVDKVSKDVSEIENDSKNVQLQIELIDNSADPNIQYPIDRKKENERERQMRQKSVQMLDAKWFTKSKGSTNKDAFFTFFTYFWYDKY